MSAKPPPVFTVEEIALFERPVQFRLPFRFGAATLDHAPQAFVRVRIRWQGSTAGSLVADGASAEMMMPKWFDKNPALDNAFNIEQLRRSLRQARAAYLSEHASDTAFGHHARHYRALLDSGAQQALEPLVVGFGPALVDRALIDALGRGCGRSVFELVEDNAIGFSARRLVSEMSDLDDDKFLRSLAEGATSRSIGARHTIGLLDPIERDDGMGNDQLGARPQDALPTTLADVIETYGIEWFKIKLCGDIAIDLPRLARIAAVLDRQSPACKLTLDGNEQFRDAAHVDAWWSAFTRDAGCRSLVGRVAWIEQPIGRARALGEPIGSLRGLPPIIIDESDADLDAFPRALAAGYRGVSSKSCKGVYKSLINLARVHRWNAGHPDDPVVLSGEDLTMQAGVAVQQDLALASIAGLTHVERNGHHYVDGMQGAPATEQMAFARAHPDLYSLTNSVAHLVIRDGRISTTTLEGPGFATSVHPDWSSMAAMSIDSDRRPALTPAAPSDPQPHTGAQTADSTSH